jgi:OCT family organic cation transporter-like MFS transporter 16
MLSGEFGRYQGFQFFLHILSALTAGKLNFSFHYHVRCNLLSLLIVGLHMLSLVTIAAVPDQYRCFVDGVDTLESPAQWNSSDILKAIPRTNGELDQCHMYGPNNSTVPCTDYVYDRTYYQDTRAMDWNFVCDKEWMIKIAQTVYMLGVLTGALTLGPLADKIGKLIY